MVDDEAGSHHSDDARYGEIVLADDEGQIGKGDGQGRLGQVMVAQRRRHPADQQAGDIAGGQTAGEGAQEIEQGMQRAHRMLAGQHGEEQRVERDRRRIVEQAFAFDQHAQAARRTDVAEDGDDGDRIGRGNDGAEHQTGKQRHAEGRP